MNDVREVIETKLSSALKPSHIDVIDESHGHNVPKGAQTHFKVVLAAAEFEGLMAVKRHQRVYSILKDELTGSVHALALHLYTPDEWRQKRLVPQSPVCLGGSRHSRS